jgi:hypothetical protein
MSIGRLLPVLTDKQTISEPTRTSHQGQKPKYCTRKKKRRNSHREPLIHGMARPLRDTQQSCQKIPHYQ